MLANNLIHVFDKSVESRRENVCLRFVEEGEWRTIDWLTVRERVQRIAGGLRSLGVMPGDRVAILSKTRYEWTLADLGILAAGGVVVPIYESNLSDQVEYILNDSGAKAVFVENAAQFQKVLAVHKNIKLLQHAVMFTEVQPNGFDGIHSLTDLENQGAGTGAAVYAESLASTLPEADASFVYTSGTTGNPKGVILTHENFLEELAAGIAIFKFEPYYETVIFLPLAHILARIVQYFQLSAGFIQAYAESIDRLNDNIATIRPHFMASVPRIFEKIHTRVLQGLETASPAKKKIFNWAWSVGERRSRLMLAKQAIPFLLDLQYRLATKLIFSKLHDKLGGRVQFFISGGAPLPLDVALFFHVFGFKVLEGYGLTETSGAICVNHPDDVTIGTVGQAIPGCEIKIAADGEIMTRGKMIFRGYYGNSEATREAFDSDGWFHTGDIGEFDSAGHLKITDRKKDLIITAGGKNVAPQNIENLMRSDPYISQFVVHGDRRKFLSALVTLEKPEIEKFARDKGIAFHGYEELIQNDNVYQFIKARIDDMNKRLAKYESIKKFAILPADFSVESGELTPTLKVKRKVINQRYKNIFDGFYQESNGCSEV